jgi:hypothetical protein
VTALKRLASLHAVGEAALDRLLRWRRFVDLYRVVQQGLIASEPGYSLKDLEVFYLPAREGDVATAADSVVAYERYRETGEAAILEEIRAYNETDCRSTKGLRDWLVEKVRPADMAWFQPATVEEEAADQERRRTARGRMASAPIASEPGCLRPRHQAAPVRAHGLPPARGQAGLVVPSYVPLFGGVLGCVEVRSSVPFAATSPASGTRDPSVRW